MNNVVLFRPLRQAKILRLLVLYALSVALAACSSDPTLPSLSHGATILAFGDSLTAGNGVPPSKAYPAVLQKLTSRKVINAGVSGETTSEGLVRLAAILKDVNPELLLLLEGGNDFLRNHDPSKTKQNLSAMIKMAEQLNIPVLLIGVPSKSLLPRTAELYSELAEEHNIPVEDTVVAKLLRSPSMKSDALHFNTQGYAVLAEAIHLMLEEYGAI